MANSLFQRALAIGFSARNKVAGQSATYQREGEADMVVQVTPGRLSREVRQVAAGMLSGHRRDFLVDATELMVGGVPFFPADGHKIVTDGYTFEVRPLMADAECWEWSDANHTRFRIHTVLVDPS